MFPAARCRPCVEIGIDVPDIAAFERIAELTRDTQRPHHVVVLHTVALGDEIAVGIRLQEGIARYDRELRRLAPRHVDLRLAGERARTLLVHDDERIERRLADGCGVDRLRKGHRRRVFHGRYGHALGRIDVSPFAQDLLRGVEKRDHGQFAARFRAGARKRTAAEGRIGGLHAGDLRGTNLVQLDGKGIQVRGTCGLQFPVDADQADLPGLLVAAAVDAYDHHDIVHVVVADPRPAVLKAVGIG